MLKFVMPGALLLGSLVGSSVAAVDGESARMPRTEVAVAHADYRDFGPYDYLTDAIKLRDAWRRAGHAANVITKSDGYYWVRVCYD
jgi:hypothetical protein